MGGKAVREASTTLPRDSATREYAEAFALFDQNGDGTISAEELGIVVRCLGQHPTETELIDMINEMDANNSGYIEQEEFVAWMAGRRQHAEVEQELMEAFAVFDLNNDGTFPTAALDHILRHLCPKMTEEELDELTTVADSQEDGKVRYEEFVKAMVSK